MAPAAKREAIVERLADHVLAHGLAGTSLRPLAAAAGISDRMLLYYFRDKAEVVAATLACIAVRMQTMLDAATGAGSFTAAEIVGLASGPAFWPYMQVWLDMASAAARGDAVARAVGEAIGRGFLAWGRERLVGPAETRDADAARMLVMVEGAMLLTALGLGDVARQALARG